MKRIFLLVLLLLAPSAFAKTLQSIAVLPNGAVLQSGSSLSFGAACTYSDGSSDNCAAGGGVTWSSSSPSLLGVNGNGGTTAIKDPGVNKISAGYVLATVGGQVGRSMVYVQHPGDTWYEYMTPDITQNVSYGQQQPANVTVGSTIAVGAGVVANYASMGATGTPIQGTCNWSSSNTSVATVNTLGDVTGVSPGNVTITCGRAGNGTFGTSTARGWVAPGNVIPLTVVNGGTSSTTWYIRPDGGTPFVSASTTPNGQCDGKHDAAYPGSGVNQPCGLGNLSYLWLDTVSYAHVAWMIQGGDTVIVRQKQGGYTIGALSGNGAPNCAGDTADCYMPTIPSGTVARHTRILGENYGSCHSDTAKTTLLMNEYQYAAINIRDSQFVDVSCLEVTDTAACAYGNFTNGCANTTGAGNVGLLSSALSAQDNMSDLFIHGLAGGGWHGAVGTGVVADHLHIRASPSAGIDMDDDTWQTGNISVAGGFALTNSVTEFTGCVEEYPVVHNYPYIECRDQSLGGYGDGFGTASTSGDWLFDHDVWRYNYQDGLDLLHSGMHTLTITNSQSYGNDGQQYKIGSGDNVLFANNLALHNCQRILQTIGDEPASAILPGVTGCRAAGDGIALALSGSGSDTFYNNTYVGYGTTSYDMFCEGGYDSCTSSQTLYRNNLNLGILKPSYNPELPGLFYPEQPLPANGGWAVRDHNLFYNFRNGCPSPLLAGEICADPQLVNEPSLTISNETQLDNFNFALSSASPARFAGLQLPSLTVQDAGVTLSNVLATDQFGTLRPATPSIGGEEVGGTKTPPPPTQTTPTVNLSVTPNPVVAGASLKVSATVSSSTGTAPSGSVTFVVGSATTSANVVGGVATATIVAPSAGSYSAQATYSGDSNFLTTTAAAVTLTVSPAGGGSTTPPKTTPPSSSNVTISVSQPQFGFNVIPGSVRRLYATVLNGKSNGVSWTVKSGGATLSATTGPWVDVTAPATGSSCQATRGSAAGVTSATQFVVEAASQDDTTKTADIAVNVCNPSVEVSVVPGYRTLYAGQMADLQSLVVGSVDTGVTWAITAGPQGGNGVLSDNSHRDTVFVASVPGRYTVTATSTANQGVVATSTIYVTGNPMPYPVTPNHTEPVDCTVDPALRGGTYDVGPSQQYHRLQDVPLGSLVAGSTVRIHNEDTTGANPTVFNEAIQIGTSATADQPVRVCGVPDGQGNLPILDATNAVVHPDADANTAGLALIALAGNSKFYAYPVYRGVESVQVEGVHLRNARPSATYTTAQGASGSWKKSASCLLIDAGHDINVVGVEMEGCVTGGQSTWTGSQWNGSSLDHLWEGNHIHGNGLPGSSASQLATQAWGNVVQFNAIDGIVSGSLGDDLRSKGVLDVIRYNYLGDGAAHLLDITEVGTAAPYITFGGFLAQYKTGTYTADDVAAWQQALHTEYVYGNSYLNSVSAKPIHFGYDSNGGEVARKGDLFWYSNTMIQAGCKSCGGNPWTLFDQLGFKGMLAPSVEFPTFQVFNNLVWMNSATTFEWNDFDGFTAVAGKNVLPANWGANTMKGGVGDGWFDSLNQIAFQGATNLASHLSGFDASNLLTASSSALNLSNLLPNVSTTASTAVPAAVCNMPTRFSYLPASGAVVPRAKASNIGATDTASQTFVRRGLSLPTAGGCQ